MKAVVLEFVGGPEVLRAMDLPTPKAAAGDSASAAGVNFMDVGVRSGQFASPQLDDLRQKRGGTVVGRVSSEHKAVLAREAGADHVVIDAGGDFAEEVIEVSGGSVHVVYSRGQLQSSDIV